jgi:hypothetical protein
LAQHHAISTQLKAMPNEVRCQYARPGNPSKPHVVTEILPPHPLAGETAILACHNQEELKELNPGDIIIAKDNFRRSHDGRGQDYLGDALPPFMQPTSSKYIEPNRSKTLEKHEPLISTDREEDAGFTFTIKEIELRSYEHKKIFDQYYVHYGTKKEAGRQLIVFAIETLKRARSQDLGLPELN